MMRILTLTLLAALGMYTFMGCGQGTKYENTKIIKCESYPDPEVYRAKSKPPLRWKAGVAFVGNKALFIDPNKLMDGLFLSIKHQKGVVGGILPAAVIAVLEDNTIYVYDSKIENPTWQLPKTKRVYCFKVSDDKLWLKEELGEWEPVAVDFIADVMERKYKDDEYYTCMLLRINAKWFQGVYEVRCH